MVIALPCFSFPDKKRVEALFAPEESDAEEAIRNNLLLESFEVIDSELSVPQGAGLVAKLNVEIVKK